MKELSIKNLNNNFNISHKHNKLSTRANGVVFKLSRIITKKFCSSQFAHQRFSTLTIFTYLFSSCFSRLEVSNFTVENYLPCAVMCYQHNKKMIANEFGWSVTERSTEWRCYKYAKRLKDSMHSNIKVKINIQGYKISCIT